MLSAADIAARVITPGAELKLSVVTALLGPPFVLRPILRARRDMA